MVSHMSVLLMLMWGFARRNCFLPVPALPVLLTNPKTFQTGQVLHSFYILLTQTQRLDFLKSTELGSFLLLLEA
jgi:hypothetical protein